MDSESDETSKPSSPCRYRGPQGLGDKVARALAACSEAGESVGAVEEESFLKQWFAENGGFLDERDWGELAVISNQTSEHEVRYRQSDHRAVKRTLPGTFGNVPREEKGQWTPSPATAQEYLHRLALQNELFADEICLEGAMISEGPSMILGASPDGLSLVSSQPWVDALDPDQPHPTEFDISENLKERGFEPLIASFYGWRHDEEGLIVLDAKPDNFIETPDGILPIDLLFAQIFQQN